MSSKRNPLGRILKAIHHFMVWIVLVCAFNAAGAKDWFSVTSIIKDDQALNRAHDVELEGHLAFIPGKGGSLAIIDVANAWSPRIVWYEYDPVGLDDAETVLSFGDYLFLGTREFLSLDISDSRRPVFLKTISDLEKPELDRINGMVKVDNTIFAANKNGWINAFDVTRPEQPELLGSLDVNTRYGLADTHDIDTLGNYVLVVCPRKFGAYPFGQLGVIQVRDPDTGSLLPSEQWTLAGKLEIFELIGANRIQVRGHYAFTAGSWSPDARIHGNENKPSLTCILDLHNPTRPTLLATVPFDDRRGPNGLTLEGNMVFVAGGETVEAIDISIPDKPVKLGTQKLPPENIKPDPNRRGDNAHDLVYRDGFLYVSCQSDNSFMILKVEDPNILKLALGRRI